MTTRFRSLQIGVCQESHGESIHRNMSWAGYDRALPPEMDPHNLFDRMFGTKEEGWVKRKESVLDAVQEDFKRSESRLGAARTRCGWRSTWIPYASWNAAIASLPPEYRKVEEPTGRRCEGLPPHREIAK